MLYPAELRALAACGEAGEIALRGAGCKPAVGIVAVFVARAGPRWERGVQVGAIEARTRRRRT